MFERAALIHYHEIGLKGRNRASFENRLKSNLAEAVRGLTDGSVERFASRLLVPVTDPANHRRVLDACAALPGVIHVSDAFVLSRGMHDIRKASQLALAEAIEAAGPGAIASFAVDARRSSTDHPVSSLDMNVEIGAHLQSAFGLRVDLSRPDATVHVEVVQGQAYVYALRVPGPGGLPVGTSGKVVALLSAGIDSPVAAWRMAKRGAVVVAVHFSGAPQTSDESTADVFDLAEALEPAMGIGRVYSVAFGDLQRRISLECPPDLRVLLYRRLMVRVAEALARTERAGALVTGESLGQVASQTLENIAVVDAAATLPVLRPLIGSDKAEIIVEARRLGTYELSIRPHPDCCTLYMPRTPATHATVAEAEAAESALDVPGMVTQALESARWRDFTCPSYRAPENAPGAPYEP
ncbi:MAG TPA: tRNA uracil 4-sulfurtransferase ThiI [Coriobacteriia bacterium]